MSLVAFDLDETLIAEDSDHAWGKYVVDHNLVDAEDHLARNQAFYEDYKRGELDIDAYMRFSCSVLANHEPEFLFRHRADFIETKIKPLILPRALQLVEKHRQQGDHLVIVTATIEFITQPIAELFGIDDLIAPIPERISGKYTGELSGIPSFGPGKVTRLNEYVQRNGLSMAGSWFYSDSANDLPLLLVVDNPVAVNPDPRLEQIARERAWQIISLRD